MFIYILSRHKRVFLSNMENELQCKLKEKIEDGYNLIARLSEFSKVHGTSKLERKIKKEIDFLSKFQQKSGKKLKSEHLQCSNLLHLSAIVKALEESSKPCSILQNFTSGLGRKIVVDIVCDDGFEWIKVVARSPHALEQLSVGDQAYGQRSLLDQASDYLTAAGANLHHFKPPSVTFAFHSGVPENAYQKLTALGIKVCGDVVPASIVEDSDHEDSECDEPFVGNYDVDYTVLNLDITAMIAYVSALTNGEAHYKFQEKILTQQAEWERSRPVKPMLEELFHLKQLVTCQSAMNDFMSILSTLGGEGEKSRAQELISRITVVPDQMSEKVQMLKTCGKVRERSKVIFGTGDCMKVVTVSANSGFVRSAQSQNINLAVIGHESRALTEGKMKNATPI